MRELPFFARACGRVSIGGHPDKRPDSRLGRGPLFLTMRSAAGGETGTPRAQRGTRLKATTERASLVSLTLQRSAPLEACPSLPAVRNGISRSNPRQLLRCECRCGARVSIARRRAVFSPADAE